MRAGEDATALADDLPLGGGEVLALRRSFMGPFGMIDLNAPGSVRGYAERYQKIYAGIFPSTQRRVDWGCDVMNAIESERRRRLPREQLAERQAWRDAA